MEKQIQDEFDRINDKLDAILRYLITEADRKMADDERIITDMREVLGD